MKLPFKKEDFLGNIRSGNKRENNAPRNLNYFDVHHDNYTSEYSIELFKSIHKENTNKLKIKPIMNIIVTNEIYTKKIKCRGMTGQVSSRIVEKGSKVEGICNPDECEFYKKGNCIKVGRLYFKLAGIEDKGIWCYSTKSRGIEFIEKYLNLMIEQGIDITDNYFLLTLNEKIGASGKVYVPDIKLIKEDNSKFNDNKVKTTNQPQERNLYKYLEGKMVNYKSQRVPRLVFANKEGKSNIFYLTKASKKDILHLDIGTEIEILKVSKNNDNEMFLMDYNIIRAIEKNIENNKKEAV